MGENPGMGRVNDVCTYKSDIGDDVCSPVEVSGPKSVGQIYSEKGDGFAYLSDTLPACLSVARLSRLPFVCVASTSLFPLDRTLTHSLSHTHTHNYHTGFSLLTQD